MWNSAAFAIILFGFYCEQIDASCPTCLYGVGMTDGTNRVVRFRNTTADAINIQNSFTAGPLGFTAMTGNESCTNNLCGSSGLITCKVNSGNANIFECGCIAQYDGERTETTFSCVDLDECANSTLHNCSTTAGVCTNQFPGFSCACAAQYTGDGYTCTDINECTSGTHNCSTDGYCTNTAPGFTCTCSAQFTGNGYTCTDLDECSNATFNNCSMYANCTNLPPGFSCACKTGYTGDGVNCTDISECASNPCDPNANCTEPIANNYTCTCNTGYTGNSTYCTDIDECNQPATIPSGSFGVTSTGGSGTTSPCDGNATCSNTPGSFTCTCNPGYTGDGLNCTEIDECLSNPCHANAYCTDRVNNHTCTCNTGYQGDGVVLCEKQRINITISFYITCTNQVWDANLQSSGTPIYNNITGILQSSIGAFITSVDNQAGILTVAHKFTNSTDGFGSAQSQVTLTISNTNIDAVDFLKRVNTIAENTQCGAVASADECALGIDNCPSDSVCADSHYGSCCFYSYDYRYEIKYNNTFIAAFNNISSSQAIELLDDADNVVRALLNNAQNRGCDLTLSSTYEQIEQGSSIGVILMKVVNGTKQAVDIAAELAKAVGTTTTFGTILSAGDYDECARNYTIDRNCSNLATCFNYAGGFTCECNNTYYDNGTTSTGEFCITPITIDCNGTQAKISVLTNYYVARNVSLDSLHLADESCNRTTHANIVGNSIEFTFSLNDCNTTISQSTDNATIIASNYISNVPSSGYFTGYAINVPFQCNIPSTINSTTQFNASLATIDFPSTGATGGATISLNAYTDTAYTKPLVPGQVLTTADTIALEAVVLDLAGVSVMLTSLYALDVTGTYRADLISAGCPQTTVPNFNIVANGVGSARCHFQSFTFVKTEEVYIHATAMLCTPTCAASCPSRRRRDVSGLKMDGTEEVELSLVIKVRPGSNNTVIVDGIVINDDSEKETSSNVHDITFPVVAAILAFVLILLLAIAVVIVVRKQRSTNKAYDVSHMNMHAIGVKPPSYE